MQNNIKWERGSSGQVYKYFSHILTVYLKLIFNYNIAFFKKVLFNRQLTAV